MIRVLRVLEYVYPDAKTAEQDMARWQIPANGSYAAGANKMLKSATFPFEVIEEKQTELTIPQDL